MLLKAKLAPHLLHDTDWDNLASQVQPKRLFDGSGSQNTAMGPTTPMRPAVSTTDAPVSPEFQQPTSPGQQRSIMAERSARLDPNMTRQPAFNPTNANGTAKITRNGVGVGAGGAAPTPTPAAPRREATNPLTGDQGAANRNRSGPVSGGVLGGGPSFTNPTSKGIYDSHVRTLFSQPPVPPRATPLRRAGAPAL
jgi:hypothetical protein